MTLEGIQIDHYRLQRFVGSGAMGEVYLAEETRNIFRQVAIKIVRNEVNLYPNAKASDDALRLFQREMKAISALDHPNILSLIDFGEQIVNKTTYTYMVMPFRPEGSLTDWLQHRNSQALLSPREVAQIVYQAADALQHAHNRHLMHLDVKPSNFLIRSHDDPSRFPDVLLTDFGISKFNTTTSTASQTIRGTPPYMAPEQWTGSSVAATDQYALAVMVYQLLTGRFPFEGNMQQVMYKHLHERPQPPSAFNAYIPAEIDRVLLRALEKKPEDRFPSIAAFDQAFQSVNEATMWRGVPRPAPSPMPQTAPSNTLPTPQPITPLLPPPPSEFIFTYDQRRIVIPARIYNRIENMWGFLIIYIVLACVSLFLLTDGIGSIFVSPYNDPIGKLIIALLGLTLLIASTVIYMRYVNGPFVKYIKQLESIAQMSPRGDERALIRSQLNWKLSFRPSKIFSWYQEYYNNHPHKPSILL